MEKIRVKVPWEGEGLFNAVCVVGGVQKIPCKFKVNLRVGLWGGGVNVRKYMMDLPWSVEGMGGAYIMEDYPNQIQSIYSESIYFTLLWNISTQGQTPHPYLLLKETKVR